MTSSERPMCPAGFFRRLGAMIYDSFLLIGVLFVAFLPVPLVDAAAAPALWIKLLKPVYLLLVCYLFFGWFWTHGGQTLGMKAWRLRLRRNDGGEPLWSTAGMRFLGALVSWLILGLGFFWVLVDPGKRAWHDRWSRSRIIVLPPAS
ncbi:MAG: RDD family protein [Arenicellales bacterium]|nr:RDD family protein [Arenicellales bacterium]